MPKCKYCGKEFTRDRDTKCFCKATCRSLYRYHKLQNWDISVQPKKDSVQENLISVQEKPLSVQELTYDDKSHTRAENWNPEKDIL